LNAGLSELARFLAQRPPFQALAPEELSDVVAETELEFHAAGDAILTEDGGPVTFLRVIHSGAVDVVHDGRLLDLLGAGDTFGHAAMLSGLPPGFEARAAQDTLCYRIPAAVARPLLDRARSRELTVGVHEPGHQAVGNLIRSPTVVVSAADTVGEAAAQMTEAGAGAAVVELAGGGLGILTDRDLRTRIVAAGLPSSTPVAEVMTAPVHSVTPDRLGGEVLFELLERGISHAPVISDSGRLVGVVEDGDLFAVAPRSWFGIRRAIARAPSVETLAAVAGRLETIVLDLHASGLRALEVARVLSALVDAVTVRALELAAASGHGAELPRDGLVWVAVGSQARRELTPSSIPRGALVASEPPPAAWTDAAASALVACGLPVAIDARSPAEWGRAAGSDTLALAVLTDRRALFGTPREPLPLLTDSDPEPALRRLAEQALATIPPTGFDGGGVLRGSGGRSEHLDIAGAAISPIVTLARWAGARAGVVDASTPDRLGAATERGIIAETDASTLTEAFELAFELRLAHQVERLAGGERPDDLLPIAAMTPLARDQLRNVFRAIAAVQRSLATG
jgi:CBS domain-containing protein